MNIHILHRMPQTSVITISFWDRFLWKIKVAVRKIRDIPNTCPLAVGRGSACDYPTLRKKYHGNKPCLGLKPCFLRQERYAPERAEADQKSINLRRYGQEDIPSWIRKREE